VSCAWSLKLFGRSEQKNDSSTLVRLGEAQSTRRGSKGVKESSRGASAHGIEKWHRKSTSVLRVFSALDKVGQLHEEEEAAHMRINSGKGGCQRV
jgi:hypothetical protein